MRHRQYLFLKEMPQGMYTRKKRKYKYRQKKENTQTF